MHKKSTNLSKQVKRISPKKSVIDFLELYSQSIQFFKSNKNEHFLVYLN